MNITMRDVPNAAYDFVVDQLDERVHEAKAAEASRINNEGLEGQVKYLAEMYGEAATSGFVDEAVDAWKLESSTSDSRTC